MLKLAFRDLSYYYFQKEKITSSKLILIKFRFTAKDHPYEPLLF